MAINIFARYVWLLDILRRKKSMTFEEIRSAWRNSWMGAGADDDLPKRTFHNHREAINDIFGIKIACDQKEGYKYYIEDLEKIESGGLRTKILDMYSVFNQIQADASLGGRILMEDMPSGHQWLTLITDAMRENRVLRAKYRGFGREETHWFEVEPYFVKVVKRRWYMVGRSEWYSHENKKKNREDGGNRAEDVYIVYALDRITALEETENTFKMKDNFSADEYLRGCMGLTVGEEKETRIVLKTHLRGAYYMRTLPLHPSQKEIEPDADGNAMFELYVKPNFDFYQTALQMAEQVEVVSPAEVRDKMKEYVELLLGYYN